MKEFPLPSQPTDTIQLADWLELYTLISKDQNASRGDLERALRRGSIFNENENNAIEEKCVQVFFEIEMRSTAAGDSYPFVLEGAKLQLRDNPRAYAAYIFCLCLSFFQWKPKGGARINPRILFEELSRVAAERYVQGKAVQFGSRGRSKVSGFKKAVNQLCVVIGEGQGFKEQPTLNRQDDKVDLVAWKDFTDKNPSKIIIFGQCASGNNWRDKVSELQPDRFWDQWMMESKISPLLRSFYIPHMVTKDQWNYYARSTGILFDRCRIAYWTYQVENVLKDKRYINWCRSIVPGLQVKYA